MVEHPVDGSSFWFSFSVELELILRLLPGVVPEHAGLFGKTRSGGASKPGRSSDRDLEEVLHVFNDTERSP